MAKSLFGSTVPSLISAFLSMWVFGIGSTHNNPYVVSNGTIQYAFFVLALYIITRDLQSGIAAVRRRSWPLILGVPALVVVQRIVIGYESELLTFLVLFLPFMFLIGTREKLLTNSRYSFSTKLLLILTFIAVAHPYMAPLYVFDILAYIWLWRYLSVYKKTRIFAPILIILGTSIFYLVQAGGLVTFHDNFVLSRFLFGNTYEGAQGIDVGFSKKVQMLNNGNGPIVISFFIVGVALMLINSLKKELVSDIVVVTVSILTFFIYFFPESWFVRARHMIPFFVLAIGGGANVMISYLHKFLQPATHARTRKALCNKLSVLMVTLVFLPVLYCSTTALQNHLAPSITSHKIFSTFETYEFEAGEWLRETIPPDERDKTLILSDPYTINLMTSLTGLTAPYQKAWISEEEYSKEDLETMAKIEDVFFKGTNITDRWAFLIMLLNKTNTSSAIVVINGRTTHWLRVNSVFVSSSFGIPFSTDLKYVENFSASLETSPIYSVDGKLYIYNMTRS